jgi:hypothetical protein
MNHKQLRGLHGARPGTRVRLRVRLRIRGLAASPPTWLDEARHSILMVPSSPLL